MDKNELILKREQLMHDIDMIVESLGVPQHNELVDMLCDAVVDAFPVNQQRKP
tara:strand:- start:2194 stop:2352 length:159 start_codon:yes stop_codon:yes gene_type:complete